MPLIKQGKYKEYYNKCEAVKKKLECSHNRYFHKCGNYNCNYEAFSEFFYSVDDVYREAKDAKIRLEGLVEFSEQKTQESVKRCIMCIEEMEHVMNQCVEDFKSVYDSFYNDFTDVERDTLRNYEIYREI